MKKNIFIRMWVLVCMSCGLITACTSILDTTPYNQVATSNMWTTENLTDQGIAGIYAAMRNLGPYTNNTSTGVSGWGYESWGVTGQSQYALTILAGSPNPGTAIFSELWRKLYEGVHRANDAIYNIPIKSPIAEAKKGRLISEAKFLRAFFYYRLNELFRGVPYYNTPVTEEECINTQETEAQIWQHIIDDLTDCINEPDFPNTDFTEGRATKGAAYALRGKTYMQMGKWAEAASDFDNVGKCGYSLFEGGYKELFYEANERSPEMIFSIQNVAENGYGSYSQFYCGTRSAHSTVGTNSWGDFQVHPDAVDLYENADGTEFNWDDIIPGYSTMPIANRQVYFVRDTLEADGVTPKYTQTIRNTVRTKLASLGASAANYLPSGNEARIMKAYANRDPRLQYNVITPYYGTFTGYDGGTNAMALVSRWPVQGSSQHYTSTSVNDMSINAGSYLYYFHRKFVYEGYGVVSRTFGPTDDPLIRYADVLLMWAEALVELNDLSGAAAKVNMVRGRASVGMPGVVYSGQDDLRQKVRDERRREFVNEGISFFDEMRWGTWKDTKFKGGTGGSCQQVWGAAGNGGVYTWPSNNDLSVFPVPQAEVEKNSNIVKTPGWSY